MERSFRGLSRLPVVEMTTNGPITAPITGGPEIHALLAEARAQHWYALTPFGFPAFLRYRDTERLLRDPRFREVGIELLHLSGITDGPIHDWFSLIMFAHDGDAHRRLRVLVSKAFTPSSVESTRPLVRADLERCCDDVDGELELVGELAHWAPVMAVGHMLDIPEADVRAIGDLSARLGTVFSAFITPEDRGPLEAALVTFTDYVRGLIADRRARPGDDLMSRLIASREGDAALTEDELVAMVVNLVIGGHDATERLIANAMWTLLRHPDEWRALVDDPSLVAGAVEEVLRYEPSAPGAARVATEVVDWDGLQIAAGTLVGTVTAAANRDPEVFTDPHRFDVRRRDARHLTFGGGPHLCLGAALARLVAQEAIDVIGRRWPDMRLLDEDPPWAPVEAGFRGITRLRLATA